MAKAQENAVTHRTVVLLKTSDKKRLQKLAREGKVSASEIVRRSIGAYEASGGQGDEALRFLLREMNEALDKALASSEAAHVEIQKNLSEIRERRAARIA